MNKDPKLFKGFSHVKIALVDAPSSFRACRLSKQQVYTFYLEYVSPRRQPLLRGSLLIRLVPVARWHSGPGFFVCLRGIFRENAWQAITLPPWCRNRRSFLPSRTRLSWKKAQSNKSILSNWLPTGPNCTVPSVEFNFRCYLLICLVDNYSIHVSRILCICSDRRNSAKPSVIAPPIRRCNQIFLPGLDRVRRLQISCSTTRKRIEYIECIESWTS